nr:MAG: hypothetical protein H1Bulk3012803_000002 [Mitovirus sp.]
MTKLRSAIAYLFSSAQRESIMTRFALFNALKHLEEEFYRDTFYQLVCEVRKLKLLLTVNFARELPFGLVESLYKLMSLGPYLYLLSYFRSLVTVSVEYYKFKTRVWKCTWEEIEELVSPQSTI